MQLSLIRQTLDLSRPIVMGILNVTTDSFSDGGVWPSVQAAVDAAGRMVDEGAALIDVGGESTRPGAASVNEAEELERVIPVLQALHKALPCPLSIDTMKPSVMTAAVAAGAQLINDVNALRAEGALAAAAASGAAVCLMHMQGSPRTMQAAPQYQNVVAEVRQFLQQRMAACAAAGIASNKVLLDPGIGFGKSLAHNLSLLAHIDAFTALGTPVLLGASRKSLYKTLFNLPVDQRVVPSVTTAVLAAQRGAAIIRAHDVAATVQALQTWQAIEQYRQPPFNFE